MTDLIPPTHAALDEAVTLSAEILRDAESEHVSLATVAFKASRLARLLNDLDVLKIMQYESAGYPVGPDGKLNEHVSKLAAMAGRVVESIDSTTKEITRQVYVESVSALEKELQTREASLSASHENSVGHGFAAFSWEAIGQAVEQDSLRKARDRLASRRAMIHDYATRKYYELKFSGIADDVFARTRERVDAQIGNLVHDATKRFASAYENLRSENPEDRSNAVHSCRRILQDLADTVFPPADQIRIKVVDGQNQAIRLGKEQYKNRILAFVDDSSSSERFHDIVGSQLGFLIDRLESVFKAAQKGSHDTIVTREEADRYVVYTYLIVGDILSLCRKNVERPQPKSG